MAIGRLSVGIGKKGKASPHAQYIAREGKYAKPSYHEEKLENTGHGNMPKWAEHDPNYLWQMADEHERKNGTTYREHVIALPRELDENQRHELVKDWIKSEIGDKHAYQYAIHNPPAMDGGEQPHAHIMFSERLIDNVERDPDQYFKRHNSKNPEKGGAKKANTPKMSADRKAELKAMRDRWEKTCNSHLEKAGRYERISMKSLKEQGIDREPVNLTMVQIQKPEIRQAYINELDAREQAYQAKLDIYRTLNTSPLTELNKQIREQKANEQTKQVDTRLDRPVSTERHTDERGRGLQAASSIESHKLGQGHTGASRAENKTLTSAPPRDRRPKPQRPVEPTAPPDVFKENRKIFLEYAEKVETTAKAILTSQLKALKDKGAPLLAKCEKLRDNEPLFFGKDKWAKDKQDALKAFDAVKDKHNSLNEKGVTDEHREQAKQHIAKHEPSYHAKAQQAIEILRELNRAKKEDKAKQHGADFHAQQSKTYSGEILRADENGIVQQTRDGKVYHPAMSGIEQGKSYNLENNGSSYKVQEQYEVRKPDKSLDQDRGIGR
jgi:hypothetical protein